MEVRAEVGWSEQPGFESLDRENGKAGDERMATLKLLVGGSVQEPREGSC